VSRILGDFHDHFLNNVYGRYYHRALNVPKLIDVKFSYVPRNMTLARMIRLNQLSEKTSLPGLREMEEKDAEQVAALYSKFMERYDMIPLMTVEEVKHQFTSGKGTGKIGDAGPGRREGQVTWAYVVEVCILPKNTSSLSTDLYIFRIPKPTR